MAEQDKDVKDLVKRADVLLKISIASITLIIVAILFLSIGPSYFIPDSPMEPEISAIPTEVDRNKIEDGIHLRTGLKDGDGLMVVVSNCTNCHSAKLITQNRMTAERWNETIAWMQETQGLWDLGENQSIIVDYLVANYPPNKSGGRRANLENIEWYEASK